MNHSVHDDEKLREQHFRGDYFGRGGAVAISKYKYEQSCVTAILYAKSEACKKECLQALMAYLSTLYSAINHSIHQIAKCKFGYVSRLVYAYDELRLAFAEVMERVDELDPGQKEVLMAVLLSKRFVSPFFGYRALAIELGEEILSTYEEEEEKTVAFSTYLLACARLSRLYFYGNADECRDIVLQYIHSEEKQKKLGWKTINRLARMIGDKELVKYSAEMDMSPDILLKSGV